MKKTAKLLTALLMCFALVVCVSVDVYAKEYTVDDVGVSVSIDNPVGCFCTRYNLDDNYLALLVMEKSEVQALEMFIEKDIYAYAIVYFQCSDDFFEFCIQVQNGAGTRNASDYTDDELNSILEKSAGEKASETHSIYRNKYTYIRVEDNVGEYYIIEYRTVINGDVYTISFHKESPFSDAERLETDKIIKSVEIEAADISFFSIKMLPRLLVELTVLAVVVAVISLLINRKYKRRASQDAQISIDERKPRKDRRELKYGTAIFFILFQVMKLLAPLISEAYMKEHIVGKSLVFNVFLPTVIAVILIISARIEGKYIEQAALADDEQREVPEEEPREEPEPRE